MKRTLLSSLLLILATGAFAQLLVYTPTLKSPLDSTFNQSPNVTVTWNAIAGSLGLQYQVQVDTTMDFNSPLKLDTTTLLITAYTTHELIFGQRYYWRVRAIDQGQTSYWSAVWDFTVYNAVVLSKPTNNQVDLAPNVNLEWKNTVAANSVAVVTGIRFWDFQLDTTNQFNSPLLYQGTEPYATLTAPTANLRFGTKYFYRLRARHNLSTSAWSAPFAFTVIDKLTQQGPNDNATNQFIDVTMKWKAITGVKFYEYQVALDDAFTNLVISTEIDTSVVKGEALEFGQKYFWRVRTRHSTDTSSWSNTRNYTIINTVLLKSPTKDEQNVDLKPTMIWTAQTGLVEFQLQVDTLMGFANPLFDVAAAGEDNSYAFTKKLLPGKNYYWRMRALANGGISADTTAWSAIWAFTTTASTGMGESLAGSLSIYPNPAKEKLFVRINTRTAGGMVRAELMDLLGKQIYAAELSLSQGDNVKEISLNNIGKGIYIIRLTMDGQTVNHKVIVDK
jgi:hypothetical protein